MIFKYSKKYLSESFSKGECNYKNLENKFTFRLSVLRTFKEIIN